MTDAEWRGLKDEIRFAARLADRHLRSPDDPHYQNIAQNVAAEIDRLRKVEAAAKAWADWPGRHQELELRRVMTEQTH